MSGTRISCAASGFGGKLELEAAVSTAGYLASEVEDHDVQARRMAVDQCLIREF